MKSGLLSHSSIAVALMEALAFAVTNTGAQVTDRLIESVSVSPVRILYFRVGSRYTCGTAGRSCQGGVVSNGGQQEDPAAAGCGSSSGDFDSCQRR